MFLQNKELHIGSFSYVANHKSYSYQYAIYRNIYKKWAQQIYFRNTSWLIIMKV